MARIFRITTDAPAPADVAAAVAILRGGGVAVFPTETVYGIGADIRQPEACARLFELKRRDRAQPLMAHCSDESQLDDWVAEVPAQARRLMAEFWPGPLALVFPGRPNVPAVVTGGTGTLGVRMVAHPVARALVRSLGAPIAGTSANRSGEPAADHFDAVNPVLLEGVDVAIDAGATGGGQASTVLDVTCAPPRLVRAGAVSVEALEAVIGPVVS